MDVTILARFKNGLVQFIDELINWMPEDQELIFTRILIQDQIPITEIMDKFIEHVKPFEQKIKNRDVKFFLDDPQIFSKADEEDKEKIMSLKKMWTHPEFTKEDKEKAWKWMDFFIKCINLYEQYL